MFFVQFGWNLVCGQLLGKKQHRMSLIYYHYSNHCPSHWWWWRQRQLRQREQRPSSSSTGLYNFFPTVRAAFTGILPGSFGVVGGLVGAIVVVGGAAVGRFEAGRDVIRSSVSLMVFNSLTTCLFVPSWEFLGRGKENWMRTDENKKKWDRWVQYKPWIWSSDVSSNLI